MFESMKLAIAFAGMMLLSGNALSAPTTQGIDPDYPATISNQNIWYTYQQYQVMLEEIDKSISKKNAGTLTHDATRWKSYIASLRSYWTYWQSQSFADYPVTHGRNWNLTAPLELTCDFKDNISSCEMMALIINARDELALSASAELPMHSYPADMTRQESFWASMEGYIDFMLSNNPLDEPVTAAEENLGLKPGFDKGAE